jgi:hypothetical protein
LLLDVACDAKNGTLTQARGSVWLCRRSFVKFVVEELKRSYASFESMLKEVAADHEQIKLQLVRMHTCGCLGVLTFL